MVYCFRIFNYILYLLAIQQIHHVDANPFIGENVAAAKNGEFPFAVYLDIATHDNHRHFCTGTLISNRHILTTAHCTETDSKISIYIGSNDFTRGLKYKLKTWKTFEDWATETNVTIARLFHDIAVITLERNVTGIKPAHVSNLDYKHIYGKDVVAIGWGFTNNRVKPRLLQKANLHVISRKTCLKNLEATNVQSGNVLNHLCTVARPPISLGCGDSGGPLLINGDEVIGVNESVCADDHDHPNEQNLHISVKFYRKFISSFIGY